MQALSQKRFYFREALINSVRINQKGTLSPKHLLDCGNAFLTLLLKSRFNLCFLSFFVAIISLLPHHTSYALSTSDFNAMLQKAEQRRVAIAQMMETSTVFIITKNKSDDIGMGTGFIIKENYVLTNAHVVDNYDSYYIVGKSFAPIKAELIKKVHNKVDDFALLKFNQPTTLPILAFNLSLSRTDKVSAWGYPYLVTQFDKNMDKIIAGKYENLPPVVYTEGVVSAFVEASGGQTIVHSANIAAGNSGGPLINNKGEVVGVNTWVGSIEGDEAFINGSLPAHAAVRFLRSCNIEPTIADSGDAPILTMQDSAPVRPFHAESGITGNSGSSFGSGGNATDLHNITILLNGLNYGAHSGGNSAIGQIAAFLVAEYPATTIASSQQVPSILASNFTPSEQAAAQLTGQAKELYPDALAGDAVAQAYIGASYYMGDEAPELEEEGIYWLQRAVAQNNPGAMGTLGSIYLTDANFKHPKEGIELVRKAAEMDVHFASILAYFLYRGEIYGVKRNPEEGFKAAQRGADIDDAEAISLLAYAYATGSGVKQDEKKALELAQKAVDQGDMFGHAVLSLLYCVQDTITEDLPKSLEHAKIAAEANESMGLGLLALHYIIDTYPELGLEKARELAEESALQDDEVGQFVMGLLNTDAVYGPQDLPLAWAYLEMAVRKNFIHAIPVRDEIAKVLTPEQLTQGKQYIQLWLQQWGF